MQAFQHHHKPSTGKNANSLGQAVPTKAAGLPGEGGADDASVISGLGAGGGSRSVSGGGGGGSGIGPGGGRDNDRVMALEAKVPTRVALKVLSSKAITPSAARTVHMEINANVVNNLCHELRSRHLPTHVIVVTTTLEPMFYL